MKEIDLMSSTDLILTKNNIIRKVKALLEEQQEAYLSSIPDLQKDVKTEVFSIPPKISRGENYLELPWLILDYPRLFDKENIFAIRTMFWWGKFLSITLHLSGKWKRLGETKLDAVRAELISRGYSYSVAAGQWVHHFEEDNYKPLSIETDLRDLAFIKLAKKYPLPSPEESLKEMRKDFIQLVNWMGG